jgi:hypothetical protein
MFGIPAPAREGFATECAGAARNAVQADGTPRIRAFGCQAGGEKD